MNQKEKHPVRQYSPFYEKTVPILLGLLVIIVIGVLLAAIGVALGMLA